MSSCRATNGKAFQALTDSARGLSIQELNDNLGFDAVHAMFAAAIARAGKYE